MLPPSVPTPLPRYQGPANSGAARCDDHPGQPILHVSPKRRIGRQLGELRAPSGAISMPLCSGRLIVQTAAARGSVAA
jgi:hypothetical protein